MGTKTLIVWTCDRCFHTSTYDEGRVPMGWRELPPSDSSADRKVDLCSTCARDLVNWINRGLPVDQLDQIEGGDPA